MWEILGRSGSNLPRPARRNRRLLTRRHPRVPHPPHPPARWPITNDANPRINNHCSTNDNNPDRAGQIAIHLPHNSLVMHADMQEEWKHSINPAQAIDPHPVAGNRRINITYRHYRDGFHPRNTPRCPCGVPAVLRVVTKKRENWGRYFWMCHAGNVHGDGGL